MWEVSKEYAWEVLWEKKSLMEEAMITTAIHPKSHAWSVAFMYIDKVAIYLWGSSIRCMYILPIRVYVSLLFLPSYFIDKALGNLESFSNSI